MEKGKRAENGKLFNKKFIRNIIIALIALAIAAVILMIAPDYVFPKQSAGTTLIINNKNVTSSERLKDEIIIEDGVIYLSKNDILNFFDKYLYYDSKYNQYITTSEDKEATIVVGENVVTINGISSNISGSIIERDGQVYFPISEMENVYNIEVNKIDSTNTILIDSLDREQIQAQTTKKVSVKIKPKVLSRTIEKIDKDSKVIWISSSNGWVKVRTEDGKIGYVEEKNLTNKTWIREEMQKNNVLDGSKISLMWDYYSESEKAPNREGTNVDAINVFSPNFFSLKKLGKGEIVDKVGANGQAYIAWAKQNGYQVWAMFSNDTMIETTSEILNDYKLRQKMINDIVNLAVKYGINGINVDFENMYEKDKNMYSRFIIELYPRLKECGIVLSVDVTAPDGGETWSLCFDRNVIADNSDYIIFMAYDQTSSSSTKAGTVAGYNWVKNNVDKFLGQEGIAKEKLILGIPLYTRIWTEDSSGKAVSKTVDMKDVDTVLPKDVERNWDDTLRQYYVEYQENGKTRKMWVEDIKSIREKLQIARDYDLAGVAFWEMDRQDDGLWKEINEIIFNR